MSSDKDDPSSKPHPAWASCWEDVLCLSGSDLGNDGLFAEAERLVRACRSRTGDEGIEWFKTELEEGEIFVAEQIAVFSDDADWQRVWALLMGAQAGMADASDP